MIALADLDIFLHFLASFALSAGLVDLGLVHVFDELGLETVFRDWTLEKNEHEEQGFGYAAQITEKL